MNTKIAPGMFAVLALSAMAGAQTTIYDTTGGFTTFGYPALEIGPVWNYAPSYMDASGFDVSTPSNLSSIGLFLQPPVPGAENVVGAPGTSYTVELTYSAPGQPGSVLDSWTTAGQNGIVTLTANGSDFLGVGSYDVLVMSGPSGAQGSWSLSNYGGAFESYNPVNNAWFTNTFNNLPQMKVLVNPQPTPEPGSMAVMGLGVLGLFVGRRSRGAASRSQ